MVCPAWTAYEGVQEDCGEAVALRWVYLNVDSAPRAWSYRTESGYADLPNPLPLDDPREPAGSFVGDFFLTGGDQYAITLGFYLPEGPAPSVTVTYGQAVDFTTDMFAPDEYPGAVPVPSAVIPLGNGLFEVTLDIVNTHSFFGALHSVVVASGASVLAIYLLSSEVLN